MQNKKIRMTIEPYIPDEALEKEATKTKNAFQKKMEAAAKVVGKMTKTVGNTVKGVANGGRKAMATAQSGLALLDAYLSKLGEIRGIVDQLSGNFGNNLDLANSLNTNVENLRQMHLAYQTLGVGEDMVNQSLEKFQQLVASGKIELQNGEDMAAGFLNFIQWLGQQDSKTQEEWLMEMGGKNMTANRKIMGANSKIQQAMENVRDNQSGLILNESAAGRQLDDAQTAVALMQMQADMEAIWRLVQSGAPADLIAAEKFIQELRDEKIGAYKSGLGSVTSMESAEAKRFMIENTGVVLGQSFFQTVQNLMGAEWATKGEGLLPGLDLLGKNINIAFGEIKNGLGPITRHLERTREIMEMVIDDAESIRNEQKKANADANNSANF